jgi:hypothetical protein
MYRRPKFLEVLLEIRQDMAHEADYDVDLFAEIARSGKRPPNVESRPAVQSDMTEPVKDGKIPETPRPGKPVTK